MKLIKALEVMKSEYELNDYDISVTDNAINISAKGVELHAVKNNKKSDDESMNIVCGEYENDLFGTAAIIQVNHMIGCPCYMNGYEITGTYDMDKTKTEKIKCIATGAYVICVLLILLESDVSVNMEESVCTPALSGLPVLKHR